MEDYALLPPTDEDALHALRPFNFEEKHFKRIGKRVQSIPSHGLVAASPASESLPDDSVQIKSDAATQNEPKVQLHRRFRDDMLLEFAAFDGNVIRAQLLLKSNERERDRYAEEKLKIQDTALTVKENNASLHEQLKETQRVLEARKGYDKLAEKIANNEALRSREEQQAALEILRAEIAELQAEGQSYAKTWAERREQFGKIVDEGTQMLRLIRDEKEEAERKAGMDDMSGYDRESTPGRGSRSAVPTPGGGSTPLHVATPAERTGSPHTSKLRDETINEDGDGDTEGSKQESRMEGDTAGDTSNAAETEPNAEDDVRKDEQADVEMEDT